MFSFLFLFFFFLKEMLKIAAFPLEAHFSGKKKAMHCRLKKKNQTGFFMALEFVFKSLFI